MNWNHSEENKTVKESGNMARVATNGGRLDKNGNGRFVGCCLCGAIISQATANIIGKDQEESQQKASPTVIDEYAPYVVSTSGSTPGDRSRFSNRTAGLAYKRVNPTDFHLMNCLMSSAGDVHHDKIDFLIVKPNHTRINRCYHCRMKHLLGILDAAIAITTEVNDTTMI